MCVCRNGGGVGLADRAGRNGRAAGRRRAVMDEWMDGRTAVVAAAAAATRPAEWSALGCLLCNYHYEADWSGTTTTKLAGQLRKTDIIINGQQEQQQQPPDDQLARSAEAAK